jgi:hypothetical protein
VLVVGLSVMLCGEEERNWIQEIIYVTLITSRGGVYVTLKAIANCSHACADHEVGKSIVTQI